MLGTAFFGIDKGVRWWRQLLEENFTKLVIEVNFVMLNKNRTKNFNWTGTKSEREWKVETEKEETNVSQYFPT